MRKYSHSYRRKNPHMFPVVCPTCAPERRFEYPYDKAHHDNSLHGGPVPRGTREVFEIATVASTPFHSYSHVAIPSTYSQPIQPRCPLYNLSKTELNTFVMNEIEPDSVYNASCSAVIHRLCEFMKNNFPGELRPSEIIKSGSLGKGTAVKGKSDADLVVFLSSLKYSSIPEVKRNMRTILNDMERYLQYGECVVEGKTAHSVQVSVSCHKGHSHNVDILPSTNVLQKDSKRKIYADMKDNLYDREFFSAALAPLQLDFVSRRSTKLKTLIRLVKYWRKTAFAESTGFKRLPSSYPLELITIGEWWDVDKPMNFDLRKGFYNVLKALVDYKSLAHLWTNNYESSDVSSDLKTRPYVMDPANPFNDVMNSCNCWDEVASKAKECLSKPMFFDLSGKIGWM